VQQDPDSRLATVETASDLSGALLRVLLVEGDARAAADLRDALADDHGEAPPMRHASSLSEALVRLEADPEQLVLLGLELPDASGLHAVETVVHHAPEATVVVLTTEADEATALAALRAGAQDYLVRDQVERDEVLRALQFAAERHQVQRALEETTDELRAANARLTELTLMDPLTEALDARGLERVFQRELQWARRTGSALLLLLVDLDDFGRVNSRRGRGVGDRVLRDVARAMRASIRTTDHLGRVGDDEFVVLLPDTALTEGCLVAERVRLAAAGARRHPVAGDIAITVSLGLVEVPADTGGSEPVLALARTQLSRSKEGGKNRFSWPGPDTRGEQRTTTAQLDAIRTGACLRPVFQPVVHLETGRTTGYEVLTRSTVPGYEQPEALFAMCAEAGLVTVVDQQCFEACVRAASKLDGDLEIHVNVLPSTLVDLPAASLLRAFPSDRPPSGWCVEISEQRLPSDVFALTEAVSVLRESGLSIAIDDIGYGQSSFESLVVLEPDVFKIDKRMVTDLGRAGRGRMRVLERILSVANALNAEVIAEGVESQDDVDALRRLGVGYGQGYFWGRPGPLK